MLRYKLNQDGRTFLKVSYLPKEIELIWSLLIGFWFTIILRQEVLVNGVSIFDNAVNYIVVFFLVAFYFGITSVAYARGFREGNLNSYFFIIWLTLLFSFRFLYLYLVGIDKETFGALLGASVKFFYIFGLVLVPLFYGVVGNILYLGVKQKKQVFVYVILPTIILTVASLTIVIFWGEIASFLKLKAVFNALNAQVDKQNVYYNVGIILAINIIVFVRIATTEAFYLLNTKRIDFMVRR